MYELFKYINYFLSYLIIFHKLDENLLNKIKNMGPSSIDVEIRSMAIDMGGSVELMKKFLEFLVYVFKSYKNFELANSYLALFIKVSDLFYD